MYSNRLGRLGWVALILLATCMCGAIMSSAAQAEPTRALVWKRLGKTLAENETRGVEAESERMTLSFSKVNIVCTSLELVPPGAILANEGGSKGQAIMEFVAEFDKCKVEGNGTKCTTVHEPIVTRKIRAEFVLNDESTKFGRKILAEFDPESGKELDEVKFEGEECKVASAQFTGLVFASLWSGVGRAEKEFELGALPSEEGGYFLKFPDEPTSVWLWKTSNSKFELLTPTALKVLTEPAKISGEILFKAKPFTKFSLSEVA